MQPECGSDYLEVLVASVKFESSASEGPQPRLQVRSDMLGKPSTVFERTPGNPSVVRGNHLIGVNKAVFRADDPPGFPGGFRPQSAAPEELRPVEVLGCHGRRLLLGDAAQKHGVHIARLIGRTGDHRLHI